MWYWHKERNMGQRDRIEGPKINPHIYSHLFLTKVEIQQRTIQWVKKYSVL